MNAFEPIGLQLWFLIFTPIVALLLIATAFPTVKWLRARAEQRYSADEWGFGAAVTAAVAVICLVFWVVVALPFSPVYWQDYRVAGEVLSVSNTWTDDGGDMARIPVVTLDTVDRPLVIDDPRAVTLEGQRVVLTCSVGWHFRAADTFSCRIAQIGGEA